MSDSTEPVICIEWLNGMMKGRWVQANEVMNGSRLIGLTCGVLLDTCQQTVRLMLVPLHLKHELYQRRLVGRILIPTISMVLATSNGTSLS